ncbi:uncharacterized protein LOC111715308 isoform X2 [Eurytemora carolleeae]|uniref:uncharacterized protein LOC111715308 isoform X2 n=1 Tax=Eurytemora carolleeae TaxID=1294199 RepID=UPI000C789CD7|nr:uncharacterized protein LOC111715308 isoform X2 [Eurytemora carolleeae]|eukprot:XP_023346397.1 uncharacterized protein LOC111715308 isoform X2 [Eurytemora affinis]
MNFKPFFCLLFFLIKPCTAQFKMETCSGGICLRNKTYRSTEGPLYVKVVLYLIQLHEINILRRAVNVEVFTRFSWFEERITANETNLQVDSDLKKHLLIPETRIVNVRSLNKLDMVQGTKHDIYVSKIINGKGAVLTFSYKSEVEFGCDMDFNMYPFNNINCNYKITSSTRDSSELVFQSEDIRVTDQFVFQFDSDYDMTFYPTLKDNLVPSLLLKDRTYSLVGFRIGLKYRPLEALLVHYLPAFLLVIIGLLNQFNSLNRVAPKGGKGPTAAAVYLMACVLNSSLCMGLNVLVFRYKVDAILSKRVNFYCGLLNLFLFLLFNILYWPAVITKIRQ